jgi:toxin ParE1/3/4
MAAGRRAVIWSASARAALDDVVTYIAQDSREAALRVLVAALDTASSLDQFAERGRIVPELNQTDLRELFVFDYRFLYRVRPEEVIVVALSARRARFRNLASGAAQPSWQRPILAPHHGSH